MYVTEEMIEQMAHRYGQPTALSLSYAVGPAEYAHIDRSRKHGRNHDVTLYIRKGTLWLVIAKHSYPSGLFRAMSGGLEPGESFADGIAREAIEELGCKVMLDSFLLRTAVRFTCDERQIDWRSFVFRGAFAGGDLRFTDHHEIREIAEVPLSAFDEYAQLMRSSTLGALHYRADLHDAVASRL